MVAALPINRPSGSSSASIGVEQPAYDSKDQTSSVSGSTAADGTLKRLPGALTANQYLALQADFGGDEQGNGGDGVVGLHSILKHLCVG
jgi:hypothetical protein